jgi:hypothetical protein
LSDDTTRLKQTLRGFGLSDPAINAAWPDWWSDDAEGSPSACAELRFSLARKLGLDPRSLLEEGEPRFIWRDEARFKHLSTESDREMAAIASFGTSIGRMLVAVTPEGPSLEGIDASSLRNSILASQPFVRLIDLLSLCWSMGIPVIHLRVFPLQAKRMCAMAVKIGDRYAILLGKDSEYPAPIAYYLAHELGHIALGHLKGNSAIVDLTSPLDSPQENDHEELDADRYALELLTGMPNPTVVPGAKQFGLRQLAEKLIDSSLELRIEPGTLALCFGHSTGQWERANGVLKRIYANPKSVWVQVNRIAHSQLNMTDAPDDFVSYLHAILGGLVDDKYANR